MTFVGNLLSGGAVDKVIDLVGDFQDNKMTKQELKFQIETLAERQAQELSLAQVGLNKEEAKSDHWFVASWRPFIGWVCGLGFAMNFLVAPFATFIVATFNILGPEGMPIVFPQVELTTMLPVLLGMLGLGGLRTFEKTKGVSREKL